MRGKLIIFLGSVGAGKSTHAILLYYVLRKRNVKVFGKFTIKTHHLLGYVLEWFLVKVLFRGRLHSKYAGYTPIRVLFENKPSFFSKFFRLWCVIDFVSVLFVFLITVVLPLKLGYTAIVEEGLLATLADYVWLSRLAGIDWKERPIRYLLRTLMILCFAYEPFLTIYLDADLSTLRRRWRLRGTPEERYDYVLMQKRLIKALCRRFYHCYTIDTTNNTIAETAKQIIYLYLHKINV